MATMCRVLEVSTSGYYAWRKREPSRTAREDARLQARIEHIHADSRGTYGAPRVHAELAAMGQRVGRKRVARLMKRAGLQGVSRRRRRSLTRRAAGTRPAPDLVQRHFAATAPNHLWVADITYVATWTGWLYLAVVLDAFSRRVLGWTVATHLRAELVLEALEMAVRQRCPEGVIHHSDQGSQYTCLEFGNRCRQLGVVVSTGSAGDCYDNALAESFFATLETELLWRRPMHTRAEGKMAIFEYIEGFYNTRRRHSSLGYLSPAAYERRYHAARTAQVETAASAPIAARSAPTLGSRCAAPTSSHLPATVHPRIPSTKVSTETG